MKNKQRVSFKGKYMDTYCGIEPPIIQNDTVRRCGGLFELCPSGNPTTLLFILHNLFVGPEIPICAGRLANNEPRSPGQNWIGVKSGGVRLEMIEDVQGACLFLAVRKNYTLGLNNSFIHSIMHSFIHLFIHVFIHSFIHSFIQFH